MDWNPSCEYHSEIGVFVSGRANNNSKQSSWSWEKEESRCAVQMRTRKRKSPLHPSCTNMDAAEKCAFSLGRKYGKAFGDNFPPVGKLSRHKASTSTKKATGSMRGKPQLEMETHGRLGLDVNVIDFN